MISLFPNKTIEISKEPQETLKNKVVLPSIDSLHIKEKSIENRIIMDYALQYIKNYKTKDAMLHTHLIKNINKRHVFS